jgi:predicted 3-demethylubiquinone-9 3-methyltransferase (glyoxalase superfamily)
VTANPSIERTGSGGLRPPTAVAHDERWPYEDNTLVTVRPQIVPHLWFEKEAEEAANFYCSVFPDSRITSVTVLHDTPSGDCDVVSFSLSGQPFMAISAGPFFKFNESVSFMVKCETQEELDYYWQKLSAVPEAEQCGWLKDRFGLSWQIVPAVLDEMMQSSSSGKVARVTQAFLKMKKFDIAALQEAYGGQ